MAKLTLTDITGGFGSVDALNANFTAIENAIENTLSLDGTTPNSMSADIDAGSNKVINVADGVSSTDAVNVRQLAGMSQLPADTLPSQTGNANKVLKTDGSVTGWASPQTLANSNTPAGNIAATTIQTAINELDTEKAGLALNNTLSGNNTFSGTNTFSGAMTLSNARIIVSGGYPAVTPVTTGGTSSAMTATVGETAYTTNRVYRLRAGTTHLGGALTLNLDGLGAQNVVIDGNNPYFGAIQTYQVYDFRYTGTNFILVNPSKSFRGALVNRTTTQSISNATYTTVLFDQETYDIEDWHSTSVNTDRITVPIGVSYVKLSCSVAFTANATGTRGCYILKNGSTVAGTPIMWNTAPSASVAAYFNLSTPTLAVTSGDYFTVQVYQNSGGALTVNPSGVDTWFSMEGVYVSN